MKDEKKIENEKLQDLSHHYSWGMVKKYIANYERAKKERKNRLSTKAKTRMELKRQSF